ncbi:YccT family protein [Vibrio paucivorans]|uniref:UPF0319 protein MD483_16065 n=1 Tax=Vibrio paucivorans TaxID=2829489 RepID=A0A9X3HSV9_9VIBR|nr:DUF2057 domain-containing protein [Vibrio paucivorans]MCW8335335.1 DUF2057 domain-containing protein [Vibrio paucivorans]
MRFKKSLLVAATPILFSSLAFADGALNLQTEITPRVLNGAMVSEQHYQDKNTIALNTGSNQLAVTIGQIVFEDGKRRKFDSQPLLLQFDVKDQQTLSISYEKFRTIEDANKFAKNPDLTLETEEGKPVKYELVQLNKGGLQGFRDYEREVADYNAKMGNSAVATPAVATTLENQSTHKPAPGLSGLQQEFGNLTAEQQQQFMQWAMRNLK